MFKDDTFFRKIEKNCWCLQARCNDMARTNVDTQILSTVPVMFNYWAKSKDTLEMSRVKSLFQLIWIIVECISVY